MTSSSTSLCRDCFSDGAIVAGRCSACGSRRTLRHPELTALSIAHLDCDAFYASVEKRDAPELRDRPVIVGGGRRGVVTTACYIARLSGVRSAMPMFKALKLCPQAVVIKPAFPKYRAESRRIFDRLRALTPLVQTLSLDEAWIDLAGTERLHGAAPAVTLARLQAEIERDVGLTVSIGLAPNKFLAKIASEIDKPRGFAVIGATDARAFLAPRPVSVLPGVGPAMAKALEAKSYRTIADLQAADPAILARRFGAHGVRLAQLAQGRDSRPVDPDTARKSISAETTFETDLADLRALEEKLWPLCEKVARHARGEGLAGRTVTLKLRTPDFRIHTRQRPAPAPTMTAKTLFAISRALLSLDAQGRRFRLIGVGLTDLTPHAAADDLFAQPEARALAEETAMEALRRRFGDQAVIKARALKR
jgi:DNA polymerase IV